MFGLLRYRNKLPSLNDFSLSSYEVDFSLDRLSLGVDNIRHDVRLSEMFVGNTRKIVAQLITRYAGVEKQESERQRTSNWAKEIDGHKQLYREIMRNALNKAKGRGEIQVEYLAQAAIVKMLVEEIRSQYELLIGRMKKAIRKTDISVVSDVEDVPKLQVKLQDVLQRKEEIQRRVGLEIGGYWSEVEQNDIKTMHEAVFGKRTRFHTDLLNNPLMYVDQPDNEFFLIAEYDLALGRRIEDPDKYGTLVFFIQRLLNYVDLQDPASKGISVEKRMVIPTLADEEKPETSRKAYNRKIDAIIQSHGNMDLLFDWQISKADYQELKKNKAEKDRIDQQKTLMQYQKQQLHFFYRQFQKNGLLDRIVAAYAMQPEYLEYCPPLTPHQIVQYLLLPKSRRVIKGRLKRMKKSYGRSFTLSPLNKKIKSLEHISTAKCKAYLVRFLKAFARYHRDRRNYELARDVMERINPATEEKVIVLSRENNTLFEFVLANEQTAEQSPIINHSVIKADVRGSTDITHRMHERGLNPASYFSLNFFDPISSILADYDAVKVFIEGDAIILSIYERENTPADWFGTSRACGIALNMLIIIQRYNEKSRKFKLPILELGVGISYMDKAPTFLFDGNSRIMISPAINQADRLSSCSKTCRKILSKKKLPFNLYVFQTLSDETMVTTADDLLTRYNVNGIELSPDAFAKLSKEIDLKLMQGALSEKQAAKYKLYTGKFPTKGGRYQRLVIREAQIPVVDPVTFRTLKISSRKYYEVCTHPRLYKIALQMQD